ncbi:MAG: HD domain-containing protein [Proteobacteria bacterium]|nr:HD domain-containing protein [Pseudomonadota bacterium]
MSFTASFRQMKDGTRADYEMLAALEHEYALALPERILASLKKLDGGLQGYPVSRYTHSLQSATRALRDGADDELVVAALLHDIGDDLSPYNHAAIAAAILRPYVRAEVTWIVEQHALFQSYYYAHHHDRSRNGRDRYKDHPWFEACVNFCERWDQASFDPEYPTEPLERFEPLVRAIFTRPAHDVIFVGPAGA